MPVLTKDARVVFSLVGVVSSLGVVDAANEALALSRKSHLQSQTNSSQVESKMHFVQSVSANDGLQTRARSHNTQRCAHCFVCDASLHRFSPGR